MTAPIQGEEEILEWPAEWVAQEMRDMGFPEPPSTTPVDWALVAEAPSPTSTHFEILESSSGGVLQAFPWIRPVLLVVPALWIQPVGFHALLG